MLLSSSTLSPLLASSMLLRSIFRCFLGLFRAFFFGLSILIILSAFTVSVVIVSIVLVILIHDRVEQSGRFRGAFQRTPTNCPSNLEKRKRGEEEATRKFANKKRTQFTFAPFQRNVCLIISGVPFESPLVMCYQICFITTRHRRFRSSHVFKDFWEDDQSFGETSLPCLEELQ